MKGLVGFLKRKEMGLPIWAWTLIVAVVLFVLYRYMRGRSPKQAASGSPASSQEQAGVGDSGGGDASGSSTPEDTSPSLSDLGNFLSPGFQGVGGLGYPFGQNDVTTTGAPATTTAVNSPGSKVLNWAGVDFKTQAQFDSYLKSKGLSVKQFQRNHPAAYNIYQNLAKGTPVTKKSAKKSTGSTAGAAKNSRHVTKPTKPKTTVKSVARASSPTKVYQPGASKPRITPSVVAKGSPFATATKTAKTTTKPKPSPVLTSEHGRGQAKPPAKKKAKR